MRTATLPRVQRDTNPAITGDLLAEHGAVIVEGLLSREVVDAVNREVDAAVTAADPTARTHNDVLSEFHGDRTRHVTGVAAKSRTFATEVMAHPLYGALCDRFLLPHCSRWQLNLAHLIVRGPGAQAQPLHRDEDVWMEMPLPRVGELQLASMIAFVDFTEENGATRVVPGSHRFDDRALPVMGGRPSAAQFEPLAVHAVMPAGSAVLYLGSTYHAASENRSSDVWRRAAHVSFALGWLRTEENNYLAVPPAVARELPARCQEILGYPVCGFLGTLDMQDPATLLAEGRL
jgi:ectoine hydroxylase-related dioxygenase (phytanoyl-CoA dioxygenase family)